VHLYSRVLSNNKTFCPRVPLFLGANYFIPNKFYWYLLSVCIINNQNILSILIILFELSTSIWAKLTTHSLGPYLPNDRADLNAWSRALLANTQAPQARVKLG